MKLNNNLIQLFARKKQEFFILYGFYQGKSYNFSKFILKLRVFFEEFSNLGNLSDSTNFIANKIDGKIQRVR